MPAPPRGLIARLAALHALAGLPGRNAATAPAGVALTCYTKPGCTLCDKAKVPVARAARGLPVTVAWVNILDDPALLARWGERIPVVAIGDTVLAEGKVSELRLRRALEAHLRQIGRDGQGDER